MTFVEYCNAMGLLSFTYLTVGLNEISDKSLTLEWEGQDTKLTRLLSLANKFDAEIEFDTRLNADSSIKQFILNVYHKNDDTHLCIRVAYKWCFWHFYFNAKPFIMLNNRL